MTRDPEECAPSFPSHAWTEGLAGRVCPQCGATKPCCNSSAQLSTERQARETAEMVAAEYKEEAESQCNLWRTSEALRRRSEAKLAALPAIVAGLRFDLRMQCQFGPSYHQAIKDNLDKLAALSPLPPPVPAEEGSANAQAFLDGWRAELSTEEGEPVDFADLERTLRMCEADRGHNPGMISIGVEKFRALLSRAQAPQDVAGLVEGDALAQFLHDEIELPDKFVGRQWPLHDDDDGYRGDGGYVKLQPKDIVERYRDAAKQLLARYPALRVTLHLTRAKQHLATVEQALAAFQSRQEGQQP